MENKIFEICAMILEIADEEVEECRMIADGQKEYINPLKPVTQNKQNELGEHNHKCIDKLLELKAVIEEGARFQEKWEGEL